MRTLIQHGTLVSPTDTFKSDLVIEDEKIAGVGTHLHALYNGQFDKVVDATGRYVIPGLRRAYPPGYAVWRDLQRR